jgi:hypothetical protein
MYQIINDLIFSSSEKIKIYGDSFSHVATTGAKHEIINEYFWVQHLRISVIYHSLFE